MNLTFEEYANKIQEWYKKAEEWDKVVLNPNYIEQTKNALKGLRTENKQLKEELRKYQILQYSPKELEIELNKEIINRLKLEKIEELYKNSLPYDQNLGIKLKEILEDVTK